MTSSHPAALWLMTPDQFFAGYYVVKGLIAFVVLLVMGRQFYKTASKSERHALIVCALGLFVFFPAYMTLIIYFMQPYFARMSGGVTMAFLFGIMILYVGVLTTAVMRARG